MLGYAIMFFLIGFIGSIFFPGVNFIFISIIIGLVIGVVNGNKENQNNQK